MGRTSEWTLPVPTWFFPRRCQLCCINRSVSQEQLSVSRLIQYTAVSDVIGAVGSISPFKICQEEETIDQPLGRDGARQNACATAAAVTCSCRLNPLCGPTHDHVGRVHARLAPLGSTPWTLAADQRGQASCALHERGPSLALRWRLVSRTY